MVSISNLLFQQSYISYFHVWQCSLMYVRVYGFTLASTVCFHVFTNKGMHIHFISGKILLQHIKKVISCKADAFYCLYIATVPVRHMCTIANQAWAYDMHLSCVVCTHWYKYACQKLHASVHVHTKSLSFTHIKHVCRHNLVEVKSQMMWFCSTRVMMWLDNCIISHWLFLYDTSFQS